MLLCNCTLNPLLSWPGPGAPKEERSEAAPSFPLLALPLIGAWSTWGLPELSRGSLHRKRRSTSSTGSERRRSWCGNWWSTRRPTSTYLGECQEAAGRVKPAPSYPQHGENSGSHSQGFSVSRKKCHWRCGCSGIGLGLCILHLPTPPPTPVPLGKHSWTEPK